MYLQIMKVHRSTFEQDLKEKEKYFLKLSGEERLRLMRIVSERMHNSGVSNPLAGSKVRVIRLK